MRPSFRSVILQALCLAVLTSTSWSQVPSFRDAVGHDIGSRITLHHQMMSYLLKLENASDRVKIIHQGESWEGRAFKVAIVTSPSNHARLKTIQDNARKLADPRTLSRLEMLSLVKSQPAIVWLGGSIHGFELSGSEGLLMLLDHLATKNDSATMNVLNNTVILIDPVLNPDGRDAFAHINIENMGRMPNPEGDDWGNSFTSWQAVKFRTGHYYFDTNRDWFAHTQRETRTRIPTILSWRPQVGIDAHEMGSDVEFYFDPPTQPYSPYFPDYARRWFVKFGESYAKAFDRAGFEYMTREQFNYFYPGYTTVFLSYQGAVGMLYEQGSSRGLALKRPDESTRTLLDALRQQYTAAWAALQFSAGEREKLLIEYYESHLRAIEDGQKGTRRYFIMRDGDPHHVTELINVLVRNGIEVGTLAKEQSVKDVKDREGRSIGSRSFPAGTYVVESSQPRGAFLKTLLEPHLPLPEEFLKSARERLDRGENPRFYDITAWSLPLMFNVNGYTSSDGQQLPVEQIANEIPMSGEFPQSRPTYAYLIDGKQSASMSALYHLKEKNARASFLWKPTKVAGKEYPSGTVIVRISQNENSIHEVMRNLSREFGLRVDGVNTGFGGDLGPSLGSGDATFLVKKPVIGIVAEDPFQGYSFGWAWYTLDRQYNIPVTVLRAGTISRTKLDRFNVLILPEVGDTASLARLLGPTGMDRIARWVREGGTLVTIGSATEVARKQLNLIKLRSWYEVQEKARAKGGEGESTRIRRFSVPGSIFRASLEPNRWITAGYDAELAVFVGSDRLYLAPDDPPSSAIRAVARYEDGAKGRISGHAWKESLERIGGALFLYEERVAQGRVICFAEDPNFRGYWRGANRLFLNAVILGPSAP
ncbi:MAG: hypothetical protein FJ215_02290 [Ignavibacteria bacterium]|nr:hypothetical protein [Ignavibacteria bacterium]